MLIYADVSDVGQYRCSFWHKDRRKLAGLFLFNVISQLHCISLLYWKLIRPFCVTDRQTDRTMPATLTYVTSGIIPKMASVDK